MAEVLWKPRQSLLAYFFFASAVGLLLTISQNILLNGTSESAIFLGLSAERWALIGGSFIVCLGLVGLGWRTLRGKPFQFLASDSHTTIHWLIGITLPVFLAAWCITWIPAKHFGTFYYYLGRLYPFIVWLMCSSGIGLALLLVCRFGLNFVQFRDFLRKQRAVLIVAFIALFAFGLVALGIILRVIHMQWFEEDFWYGAGVPVLVLQVLLAIVTCLVFVILGRKFSAKGIERKLWFDWMVFFAIWAISASIWVSEPTGPDFFITRPTAPNYELYPDYDSKYYDIVSQYALMGQGLNNHVFFDRPLYSALLVYLHGLAGQNYLQLVAWQTALFAILPALGYLLGRQLHGRALGAGLAVLFMLRGANSIELGPFINTAHQKQLMTDFPSAVLMLLMTILLVRWLRDPGRNWLSLGWAAGVLGLATLLRPHPLIYLPILVAIIVWVYRSQKQLWIIFSSLVFVAAFAGVLPWVVSNGQGKSLVDLYLEKVKNVIETRYPDLHLPGSSMLPASAQVAALDNLYLVQAPTPPEKSIIAFGIDHFLNNLNTTILVLPYSPYYLDLRDTVKTTENFWRPYWNGALSPWAMFFLPINVILVALGLGAAWKRASWSGLVPLGVMLAYYMMNSLARTSGGRYIVPVDWVVFVYYLLGIMALLEILSTLFFRPQAENSVLVQPPQTISLNRIAWLQILGVVSAFAMIGAFIPLSANLFPQHFPVLTRAELVKQVEQKNGVELGLTKKEWNSFLKSPQAIIVQGRIFYPRQFDKDEGAKVSIYKFYHLKPYPRMLFTILGPNGEMPAILAAMQAPPVPNASDAVILGCRESDYVQVWAIILDDGNQIFKRTPNTVAESLTCPLKKPVCDNNHHCK